MWKKIPNFAKYRDYSNLKKEILDILFFTTVLTRNNPIRADLSHTHHEVY